MVISVKEATIHDAETISRLATETFYETYSWHNTAENMKEYTETHFNLAQTKNELKQEGTYFFLVNVGAEVIGYAKLRSVDDPPELKGLRHIEIERIYVQKQHQNKKAGYALIKKCIEKGREIKLDTIWLGVWEKNTKALAFYEKVGFKKFGIHNFQLGDDVQNDHLVKYDLG